MKHTPGPWKWWTSNSFKRLKHDDGEGNTSSVLEPYICSDGQADIQVTEGDMALIAAAPYLLKVCKDMREYFETAPQPLPSWILRRMNEVIAKAEGTK